MLEVKKPVQFGNSNLFKGQRKKRKKIVTFDEDKRREFLTGFHKRKVERRKKAQEKLEAELKEEKKRLKQDARERYKKLLYKRPQIDIDEFVNKDEFETETHKVSILELDVSKFGENHIGPNTVRYEEEESGNEEKSDNQTDSDNESEISGFEAQPKKKKPKKEQVPESEVNSALGSKKEVKKSLKAAALKELHKSKAFKKKKLLEKHKNKRQSKVEKIRKSRMEKKKGKKAKGKK